MQIVLGTVFSSVGLFVFYLIFEKFVKSLRGSTEKEKAEGVDRIRLRVKQSGTVGGEEEMEQLVYEEYDTEDHEVLSIVLETETTTVGVALFLSDRLIEYYWSHFPQCCLEHTRACDVATRSYMTAISIWAEKWTLSDCVNILSTNEKLVRGVGDDKTELARWVLYQYCKNNVKSISGKSVN